MTGGGPELWLFVVASLLLIVAPGPDLLFLIVQSIARGARTGLPLALGLACGCLVHSAAAVFGAALIFRSNDVVFLLFKIGGAGYLLFIAGKTLWESGAPLALGGERVAGDGQRMFARGMLMNSVNPKVSLFFLAFLPQFVPVHAAHAELHMFALGGLFAVMTAIIFCTVSLAATQLNGYLQGRPWAARVLHWVAATVLVGMAWRLLWLMR